jgi:hypothetical protein
MTLPKRSFLERDPENCFTAMNVIAEMTIIQRFKMQVSAQMIAFAIASLWWNGIALEKASSNVLKFSEKMSFNA